MKFSFNIFIVLALCSQSFSFFSCSDSRDIMNEPTDLEDTPIDTMENTPFQLSFLALGDSYTIGQGVAEEFRWPNQLGARLQGKGFIVDPITIIAQTGWTTGKLLEKIEENDPDNHDLVSLLIGVNNQYQGVPFQVFETEFDSLLHIAIQLSGDNQDVFVVSIPDYGVTPFGASNAEQIGEELDAYNAYMDQKCETLGIPFINITELSRQLGDNPGALAPDNLHPSGSQYAQWVNLILPVAIQVISN